MPFTPDQPYPKVQGSTIRSKDWNDLVTETQRLDTAKVNRAGADSLAGPLSITGALTLGGGVWDLATTEGDFKIGNAATRLKVGVALGGAGAGDVRIRSQGGTNRLALGGGTSDAVIVVNDQVGIGVWTPTVKLDVAGDLRITDKNIWFRGDTNHGVGWYGPGKLYANASVDGPVLFGFSGGGVGTTNGGQRLAINWNSSGNVGIGTSGQAARLEVVTEGAAQIAGTQRSPTLCVTGPALGTGAGSEQVVATFGFSSGNNSMFGVRARRNSNGSDWTTTAIGLGMDVDNTRLVNNASLWIAANGGVGVGVAAPTVKLDVAGDVRLNDSTILFRGAGDNNHGLTYGYSKFTGSIDGPVMYGWSGGGLGTTAGGQRLAIMWNSSGNVGFNGATGAEPVHIRQNGDAAIRIDDPTNGGIYFRLHYEQNNDTIVLYHNNGAGQFMRQDGAWHQNSDMSLKENVTELNSLLDRVVQLRPVSFDWKVNGMAGLGFIAQEVEPVFPELVAVHNGLDGEPIKGLPYATFGVLAIGAIKEMKARYDARIEALEAQVRALSGRA